MKFPSLVLGQLLWSGKGRVEKQTATKNAVLTLQLALEHVSRLHPFLSSLPSVSSYLGHLEMLCGACSS